MTPSSDTTPKARNQVLREADFNPRVRTYWLLNGIIICVATVVGIAVLPIWLAVGHWITGRYLERMRLVLTRRTVEFSKGVLVRTEKTVPLDKITDVGMVEGPIMRILGIKAISFETAGQSSAGALVQLVGVENAADFREAILDQRDRLVESLTGDRSPLPAPETGALPSGGSTATGAGADDTRELLTEIRDALVRIEGHVAPGAGE
jgi:putative membrane protein